MNATISRVARGMLALSCTLTLSAMAQTPAQPKPALGGQPTESVSTTPAGVADPASVPGADGATVDPKATPAMPANPDNGENRIPVGAPGSLQARVAACTMCHGATGVQGADAFYPRIAGKPAEYLYQQLLRFREGRREYLPMQRLLVTLSDAYLHEIALWFSEQKPEYPPSAPLKVSPAILEQGEQLVRHGAPDRDIPACIACHGANLKGMQPAIPGLTGLTNEYITAQMGAWQYGIRHSVDPDCMGVIAKKMTSADVQAVSAWLAMQDPGAPGKINDVARTPVVCGIQNGAGGRQ